MSNKQNNKNIEFDHLMYRLPIEIGNKIFNYLMPSKGDHKKKMAYLMKEIPIKYQVFWINRTLKWIGEMRASRIKEGLQVA
jgi:hypothetical protein